MAIAPLCRSPFSSPSSMRSTHAKPVSTPASDASTLATRDTHLVVRMKDLVQGTTGRV